jgi:triosephosphate isomerase
MAKLIVANLKMNLTYEEAKKYKDTIGSLMVDNLVVCPPFLYLDVMKSNDYLLGAQDGFYIDKGAYTGQVSFLQLKDIGVQYSIIGHSEMRKLYEEDAFTINKKVKACLKNQITPIICVGETIEQKEEGETLEIIGKDLRTILEGIEINNIIIAYEPVWSIGTNNIPSRVEIEEVHMYIKKVLKDIYNIDATVLYGGSVNERNVTDLVDINGVDGFLIGTACIDPNQLIKVINLINV